MESKIQELAEKLYLEGVERGEKEAKKLIDEAKNIKTKLIEEAHEEAKEIITNAQKQINDFRKHTEAELKLYAAQTVEALKSEVANLLTDKLAQISVNTAFEQPNFMSQLILHLVSEWHKKEQFTICLEDSNAVKSYFNAHAKGILDNGLQIKEVSGKKHSFTILPSDGSYKITFGEEEFIEYFKEFLRPQLVELLF